MFSGGASTALRPRPTSSDPGKVLTDTGKKVTDTVKNTLTPLEKATAWCQANVSDAKIDALGGLTACANAYLEGGASAIDNLLAGLGDTVGGLLGG